MRDFLDSLIDRHFNAAPQIKPRLPSLFEPEPPQTSTDFGVSGESGFAVQPEELFARPSPKQPAVMSAQSVMEPHSPRVARPIGLPETVQSSQPIVVREINPIPQQSIPEVTVNEGVNPSHGTGDRERKMSGDHQGILRKKEGMTGTLPNKSHPSVEQDTMQPRLTARLKWAADREKMNSLPATQRSLEQTPAMRSVPAYQMEKADNRPTGVEGSSEIGPFIQPPTTLIVPVVPSAVGPEKAISQPVPVINVTIGRIEVRATMSPQKQMPKPVSRPSVMGLEEYLHRRSGGRD